MANPAARLGDSSSHGGTIISGASRTLINGIPAARKGDLHSCPKEGHGVTQIVTGSDCVDIEGSPAARVGDSTGCGAVINTGSPDTFVG
ncbi:MAG: PAAR domain-containing protein [Armatimonadota bacterium]